jgi:hypothetical protein
MVKLRSSVLLTALLAALSSVPLHASSDYDLGTGKNSCSNFIQVVDGQWSSPLNAIQFNGYLAWAHGMISGFNHYQEAKLVNIDMEMLKLDLVDRCRDTPDASYADVVQELIGNYLITSH